MKKLLTWPAPLLQKWLLSLLLCLPFLAATIVSAFSGDRTFLILSALLLLFCGVRCAELYVMLANERYCAEEGTCLSVSSIPFQRQRRVILQKSDGAQLVFCMEKNKRLSVGQAYRVYLPVSTVAVSYTHLDVYKRQGKCSADPRLRCSAGKSGNTVPAAWGAHIVRRYLPA